MKNREYIMTDEMIITLMDAQMNGADFSASVSLAKIPEGLVLEAEDYWKSFARMSAHKNVKPSHDLFERIWEAAEPTAPLATTIVASPYSFIASPYLKQLLAVASALGAMVIIISASQWNGAAPTPVPTPNNPVALMSNAPAESARTMSKNVAPAAMAPKVAVTPREVPQPLIETGSRTMMAKSASPMMGASSESATSSDPQHLMVILSQTGTREATPDTYIDDHYDQQVAAYDAAMTADNDTDHAK